MKALSALIAFFLLGTVLSSLESRTRIQQDSESPLLPTVAWQSDWKTAFQTASDEIKPLLLLRSAHQSDDSNDAPVAGVWSHPLVAEAINAEFVPIQMTSSEISESVPAKDWSIASGEQATVFFFDHNGNSLAVAIPADRLGVNELATSLKDALKKSTRPIPYFLKLIAGVDEEKFQTAEFAMSCYWEGEAKLGSIPGVYDTRAGWRENLEVVEVRFDPARVGFGDLLKTAQSMQCASKVFTHSDEQQSIAATALGDQAIRVTDKMRDASDSEQRYYLSRSLYQYLPLTTQQAVKLNSAVRFGKEAPSILSPIQRKLLQQLISLKNKAPQKLREIAVSNDENDLAEQQRKLIAFLTAENLR